MKYRYVDHTQLATRLRREDALRAEIVAVEAEILLAAVNGQGKGEAKAKAEQLRQLADTKCDREKLSDQERADATRQYLSQWCPAMEERHVSVSTDFDLRTENGAEAPSDDEQRELAHLEASLAAAYDKLDSLPSPEAKLKGDGGTRNRQARRATKKPPAKARARR